MKKKSTSCVTVKRFSTPWTSIKKKKVHDPNAPYDGGDEPDDTGQNAKSGYRKGVADQ